MSENNNSKQGETFKRCPKNPSIMVGSRTTIKNYYTKKVLIQRYSASGYPIVDNPMITAKNPRKYELVHRLSAFTYVDGFSFENWICHHKDNNKRNNLPENLLWVSPEEHDKIHGFKYSKKTA